MEFRKEAEVRYDSEMVQHKRGPGGRDGGDQQCGYPEFFQLLPSILEIRSSLILSSILEFFMSTYVVMNTLQDVKTISHQIPDYARLKEFFQRFLFSCFSS